MHSALSIVELLFRIFTDPILATPPAPKCDLYNPEQPDLYLRRHPLLSLALTCKTFSDAALHVVWRDIDGLDRLFWTMPDDLITVSVSGEGETFHRHMTFKREPVEDDWKQFDRLGALVTRFENDDTGDRYRLSSDILEALIARHDLKGAPLLPNLQSLTVHGQQFPYAHTLLGPRLSSLSISFSPSWYLGHLLKFLELATLNPPTQLSLLELKNVNVHHTEVYQDYIPLFSKFLINIQRKGEGLRRLRLLSFLAGFSSEALSLVLANERTREVKICVDQFDLDQVLPPGSSSIKKDLRTVGICATNGVTSNSFSGGSFFHEFFQRLNAPNLVSFMFRGAPARTSVSDIRAIFTSLQPENASTTSRAREGLPAITISSEPLDDATIDPDRYICTFSNAFHLLCQPISSTDPTPRFAHLRILALTVSADLTDSDIGSLSLSMPRLTYFGVGFSRAKRTGPSRTTLIGIWLLAKNCKFLDSAGIWFDAVLDWERFTTITKLSVPSASDSEGRRSALREATNSSFETIVIGDSTIGDTDVVIEFFKEVSPSLKNVDRIGDDAGVGWKAVRDALTNPDRDE